MDTFFWLGERIKTYQLLIGKQEWKDRGFADRWKYLDSLYADAVKGAEKFVKEVMVHYEAVKAAEREQQES